jgi:hypothetical protein
VNIWPDLMKVVLLAVKAGNAVCRSLLSARIPSISRDNGSVSDMEACSQLLKDGSLQAQTTVEGRSGWA